MDLDELGERVFDSEANVGVSFQIESAHSRSGMCGPSRPQAACARPRDYRKPAKDGTPRIPCCCPFYSIRELQARVDVRDLNMITTWPGGQSPGPGLGLRPIEVCTVS